MDINQLKFDQNGLIPAVVQDFYSRKVLTVAYMNREALELTLAEKRTCFYSRSRQKLWRKGETSGNFQHVARITADCDGDALAVEVIKNGPACHTGRDGCFFETLYEDKDAEKKTFSLEALYGLLCDRKEQLPEGSYTTYLFQKGREKILKKIGEESAEVLIGAMKGDKQETVREIADLCYHTLVLMAEMGVAPSDISAELASRSVVDRKVKQGG